MTSILKVSEINGSFPFAGRAAQREIVRGLNFTIVNLMSSVIRARIAQDLAPAITNPSPGQVNNPYAGLPDGGVALYAASPGNGDTPINVDDAATRLRAKFGTDHVHTLDERNEADGTATGRAAEEQLRMEQGGSPPVEDPRILAGKLKTMRDAFAINLELYATPMPNPLGKRGETYLNPYEVAEPLMVTLMKQLERPVNVNRDLIRAQAQALGLDPADVERIQIRQQEAGLRFLRTNKKELIAMFDALESYKQPEGMEGDANRAYHEDDKHEPTLESIEELETEIPAIHRARMYVNAERGFYYERDRWITAMLKRHPEASTHLKILDGCRVYLHKEYDALMARPKFYKEISDAVQKGATWPALIDLPKHVDAHEIEM